MIAVVVAALHLQDMGCLQRNTALYCCCPFKPAVAAVKRIHLYLYVHLVSLVVGTCSATYLWADGGLWGVMWVLRCQCYVLLRAPCGAGGPMQCNCALLCVATICGVQHRAATVCCYRVLEHSIHIVHWWHSLRSQGDDVGLATVRRFLTDLLCPGERG